MNYWIGQGFGILATISDISIPQFKKKWQMLIANIAVNTFSAAEFGLFRSDRFRYFPV